MTKVDRAKMRKPVGSVPVECKKLIDKLSSAATNEELLVELDEVGTTTWKVPKCELYHWVDVLDKLDEVLSKAAERSTIEVKNEKGETVSKKSYQLALDNDDLLKKLVNSILNFTALLVEYSCSRHIYPSIEHVLNFLLAKDYSIILSVLNLLYVFAKRSNFLTRISSQNRLKLKERLSVLAEDWGGKTNGMALVDCCDPSIKTKNPKCCSVRYQIAEDDNIISIDIPDVSLFGNTPSETMQLLFQKYPATERLAEEKQNHLFARVRLAWAFSEENQYERLCCIQARLHAMSVLVYAQNPATMALSSSCEEMFPSFIEESVQLLKLEDEHLLEIKSAALRTITCIVHLDITTEC